ncbi:thiamine-phosphate pyrophosphorylase [uncultured bacterium]|nr:thiamine-phosphate pyrophosphorylase [uncultured bacterium]
MNTGRIRGLYAVIDSSWVPLSSAGKTALELARAGVGIIQLRAKDEGSRAVLEAAAAVREATRGKALFIVNDRVDVAILSGADGVHLGQDDIPLTDARKLMPSSIIGVSTHNLAEAKEAQSQAADYISFGPIYPTKTKKDADAVKGLQGLRSIASAVSVPIVAIGGITVETAAPAIRAGASSVAIISDILLAADAAGRARDIISRIGHLLEGR